MAPRSLGERLRVLKPFRGTKPSVMEKDGHMNQKKLREFSRNFRKFSHLLELALWAIDLVFKEKVVKHESKVKS